MSTGRLLVGELSNAQAILRCSRRNRTIALAAMVLRTIQLLHYKGIFTGPEARSIFSGAILALTPNKGTVAVDDAIRLLSRLHDLLPEREV